MKVAIIAPDKASGVDFEKTLKNNDIDTKVFYRSIAPRVVTNKEGVCVINPDVDKVAFDLALSIENVIQSGYYNITIACNTLSLEIFVKRSFEILKQKNIEPGRDFFLLTTLDVMKRTVGKSSLFLGTSVISKSLPPQFFDTLFHREEYKLMDLSQEIIWRVKYLMGEDVHTAPNYAIALNDEKELDRCILKLFTSIQKLSDVNSVVLGCTEFPIIYEKLKAFILFDEFPVLNPAEIFAKELKKFDNNIFSNPSICLSY